MSTLLDVRLACVLLLGVGLLAPACGPSGNLGELMATPPELELEGQTKCKLRKSVRKPLIVEWPAADRAQLEAEAKGSVVVVAYDGCEMRLLPHCEPPTRYHYVPVTPKQDTLRIRNQDELYAAIPIGASGFEAKLASHGQLTITMTTVGRYVAESVEVHREQLKGRCLGATHILAGLTVGAFEFSAGADAEAGVGGEVVGVGAGVKTAGGRETLSKDGSFEACEKESTDDKPPAGCAALLRVEVVTLAEGPAPPPEPPAAVQPGPEPPAAEPEGTECAEGTTLRGRYCKCAPGELWDGSQCAPAPEPSYPNVTGPDPSPLIGRWRGLGEERARYVFYEDGSCWWSVAGTGGDEWLDAGELCASSGCRYLATGEELSIFLQADQIRCTSSELPRFTLERRQRFRLEGGHLILETKGDEGELYRSVFVRASGRLLPRP